MKRKPPPLEALRANTRARVRKKALKALRLAAARAETAGAGLSDWEGDFLSSLAERIAAHGRAFADPEKGPPGSAFSVRQAQKLKEIARKAAGEARGPRRPRRLSERRDRN